MLDPETIARFWAHVDIGAPDDCWEWQMCRTGNGYGRFCPGGGRYVMTHRYALAARDGVMPGRDVLALHSCDNRPCCNPKHLRWGTHSDNKIDRDKRKGPCRTWDSIRGSKNVRALLTDSDVATILRDGRGSREVAEDYGVCRSTVQHIRDGRTWKHINRDQQA